MYKRIILPSLLFSFCIHWTIYVVKRDEELLVWGIVASIVVTVMFGAFFHWLGKRNKKKDAGLKVSFVRNDVIIGNEFSAAISRRRNDENLSNHGIVRVIGGTKPHLIRCIGIKVDIFTYHVFFYEQFRTNDVKPIAAHQELFFPILQADQIPRQGKFRIQVFTDDGVFESKNYDLKELTKVVIGGLRR